MSLGAVYCTYSACSFLPESVKRIYPIVDKIIFLVNFDPWFGEPIHTAPRETLLMIHGLYDPEKKFEIVVGYWKDEAEQRNAGLRILRDKGEHWCIVVDDDELFNRNELLNVKNMLEADGIHAAYLVYHQIYWKDRDTIIESEQGVFGSFPTIMRTDGTVNFNENRMILVASGHTWFSLSVDMILCHHMSYVRSDIEMERKIKSFSHANDVIPGWYERVWLGNDTSTDLHPSGGPRFLEAISVSQSPYQLETLCD